MSDWQHELTRRISELFKMNEWRADQVIRQYLEEKATLLVEHPRVLGQEEIRKILGLSEKPEPVHSDGYITVCSLGKNCNICNKPTQPVKEEWCKHCLPHDSKKISGFFDKDGYAYCDGYFERMDYWKSCPICGTPRPKKLSLAEKFKDILYRDRDNEVDVSWLELAEIAEQHFKENQ